jgi:hypothetical protein
MAKGRISPLVNAHACTPHPVRLTFQSQIAINNYGKFTNPTCPIWRPEHTSSASGLFCSIHAVGADLEEVITGAYFLLIDNGAAAAAASVLKALIIVCAGTGAGR